MGRDPGDGGEGEGADGFARMGNGGSLTSLKLPTVAHQEGVAKPAASRPPQYELNKMRVGRCHVLLVFYYSTSKCEHKLMQWIA